MIAGNTSPKEFVLARQTEIDSLLQRFAKAFQYNEKHLRNTNEFYYETFDWRLYGKGFLLKRIGKNFYLCSTDGEIVFKETGIAEKHIFARDLPEGSLRQKIEPITGARAISEILTLKKKSRQYNLLNKDRKTVVQIVYDQGHTGSDEHENNVFSVLRVLPVKGYEKEYNTVLKIAEKTGLRDAANGQTLFRFALKVIGREPGDYTSGFEVLLEKEITVARALNRVGLNLLATINHNYKGILEDIDIEFLHDFRVAVRRTRSFLSQFKKFFSAEKMTFFQNELKWLGTITGPVRDLDVYLLMKDQYASMVPGVLHAGLEQFFIDLGTRRQERFAEMKRGLCSKRYHKLLSEWNSFLKQIGHIDQQQGAADQLCRPVAIQKIRKCFEKILKNGSKLDHSSPDEDLHRLRIQGKKLRYLMEFFRSFFDAEDIEFFRKQLKKLQDMLGDFNDISVQLVMLSQFQQGLTGRNRRSIAIAAAIGGLITHLTKEHEELRKRFTTVFAEFASEENIERLYTVLSDEDSNDNVQ